MTAVTAAAERDIATTRTRPNEIWRIVRLLAVKPSVFFGVPWLILGGAWVLSVIVALLIQSAGVPASETIEGSRYSWAVLSPQWYLVAVGVQAVAFTFSFALGFGSTRRDFWLGMSVMFVLVAAEMSVAIATLVQIEKATNGWFVGAGMFDALWYGQLGWGFDVFSTFAFEMFVLFVGAGVTTVYMCWRMRGMLILAASVIVLVLIAFAVLLLVPGMPTLMTIFSSLGLVGVFWVLLGAALLAAIGGFLAIRKATPR